MLANFCFSLIFEGVKILWRLFRGRLLPYSKIMEQRIIELIAGGATEKTF
jgi:hypothetical protein